MSDTTQQASGASGATQAAAPVQPVVHQPVITQAPPAPTQQAAQDLVPRSYLEAATQQAIKRKGKIKELRSEADQTRAALAEVTAERDALKAQGEAFSTKLSAYSERVAEAALIQSLTAEGLTADAAKLLIPSLRAHATVNADTFEVTLAADEIKKAAQVFKPVPPKPGAALHSAITAARTPTLPDRPLSARERLRAEGNAISAQIKGK